MKWDNWKPSKYAVLCEKRFTRDDYVNVEAWESLKSTLKRNAVPSVFDFSPHLKKAAKARTPVKRKAPSPNKVQVKKPRLSNQSVTQDPVPENKPLPPNPTVMQDPVAENKPAPPNQSVMRDHNYCTSPAKGISRLRRSLEKKRKKIRALTSEICGRKKQ
jgi:hypothetical protein